MPNHPDRYQLFTGGPVLQYNSPSLMEAMVNAEKHIPLKRGWTKHWEIGEGMHTWHLEVRNSKGRKVNGVTLFDMTTAAADPDDYHSLRWTHGPLTSYCEWRGSVSPRNPWTASNVLGVMEAFVTKAEAIRWMLERPLAPNGDHACSEDDPQPSLGIWIPSGMRCSHCIWETMALEWGLHYGISAPRFDRPWERLKAKTLMDVFAEEENVVHDHHTPAVSVRSLVRAKYSL